MGLSLKSHLNLGSLKTGADLEKEYYAQNLSWECSSLIGEVIEMPSGSTSCALSFSSDLILSAQILGEPCAWVSASRSTFFPPDFDQRGVDLNALAIVQVDAAKEAAYCAERLLKSGGFGCVVIDLPQASWFPNPLQKRIANYARKERACVLYLIEPIEGEDYERLGSSTTIFASSKRIDKTTHCITLRKKGRVCELKEVKNGALGLR